MNDVTPKKSSSSIPLLQAITFFTLLENLTLLEKYKIIALLLKLLFILHKMVQLDSALI